MMELFFSNENCHNSVVNLDDPRIMNRIRKLNELYFSCEDEEKIKEFNNIFNIVVIEGDEEVESNLLAVLSDLSGIYEMARSSS